MKSHKIGEELQIEPGPVTADASTAATGAWVERSGFRDAMGVAVAAGQVQGSTVTVRLLQATDSSGTGAKTLAERAHTVTAAEAANEVAIEVSEDLAQADTAGGFDHVAAEVETSTAVAAAGALVLGGQRFFGGGS